MGQNFQIAEQSIESRAIEKDNFQKAEFEASKTLLLAADRSDSNKLNTDKTRTESNLEWLAQYKVGRYGMVVVDGLAQTLPGLGKGFAHDWNNWDETAVKLGVAAVLGVGLRVALPKAGAARALTGTLMGGFAIYDAALPVYGALKDVSEPTSLENIHKAAIKMGDGLGQFGADMIVTLPAGIAAERATGAALASFRGGRKFEAWKDDYYTSDKNAVGRFFNWSQKTADNLSSSISRTLLGHADKAGVLTMDEKLALISANAKHQHAVPKELSEGADQAFNAYLNRKRWHKHEMSDHLDALLAGKASDPGQIRTVSTEGTRPTGKPSLGDKPLAITGKSHEPAPPLDNVKVQDLSGTSSSSPGVNVPDKGAGTVGQMASVVRDRASSVSKEDMAIADFRESVQAPLTQAMREGVPPLDRGHWDNNAALIELASGLKTADQVKQAGMLLEHFRVANNQLSIPRQLPEIVDLNQYSRSVHKDLMDLLRKEGIKPEDVLRGTNSPIFLIFDSNGAGPYTIPAIKGVTDTAVVVLPREYKNLLGVHVSGVYPHELGHDLIYGDLLRFPDSLRAKVLKQDVVAKAMADKGIADIPVDVPGVGQMKKSELFTNLLLAEANENTADIFGTAIDPNTGLSLATLLSSLRKPAPGSPKGTPGQLETRSAYGREYADPTNPLGIEPHGIDAWRIKLSAEVLRQLSKGDTKISAHADNLVALSESMRRPGDNYIWAAMDEPGKYIAVPMKEWDAIIPAIVKAQLETKLPALNDKALKDVYPDVSVSFPRIDTLAEQMAIAARNGDNTIGAFDKLSTKVQDVYSAGLLAWMKAIGQNTEAGKPGYIKPDLLLDRINHISENLRAQYRDDNFLPPGPPMSFAPGNLAVKSVGLMSKGLGNVAASAPNFRLGVERWTPALSGYGGAFIGREKKDDIMRLLNIEKSTN